MPLPALGMGRGCLGVARFRAARCGGAGAHLIAPPRASLKERYPAIPVDRYAAGPVGTDCHSTL